MTRRRRYRSRGGVRVITNVARTFFDTPITVKSGAFAGSSTILTNNTGGPGTENTDFVVGQKYRVSRLFFNAQLEGTVSNDPQTLENMALWVMKLPEGYSISTESELWAYPYKHPEWVLGWKFFGNPLTIGTGSSPSTTALAQLPVRSRRTTILQPGDKIIAVVTGNGADGIGTNHALLLSGIVDYRLTVN